MAKNELSDEAKEALEVLRDAINDILGVSADKEEAPAKKKTSKKKPSKKDEDDDEEDDEEEEDSEEEDDDSDDDDSEDEDDEEDEDEDDEEEDSETSIEDVREALAGLQSKKGQEVAKTVLQKAGGVTALTKLDKKKFEAVITAAKKAMKK